MSHRSRNVASYEMDVDKNLWDCGIFEQNFYYSRLFDSNLIVFTAEFIILIDLGLFDKIGV